MGPSLITNIDRCMLFDGNFDTDINITSTARNSKSETDSSLFIMNHLSSSEFRIFSKLLENFKSKGGNVDILSLRVLFLPVVDDKWPNNSCDIFPLSQRELKTIALELLR